MHNYGKCNHNHTNWVKGYAAVAENSCNASVLFSFSVQTMQFTKYFDATDVADTMLGKC